MKLNLWEQIGNLCLDKALRALQNPTTPTAATVEAVKGLVKVAIAIDTINLRWAAQNRFGAAGWKGQPSGSQEQEVTRCIKR